MDGIQVCVITILLYVWNLVLVHTNRTTYQFLLQMRCIEIWNLVVSQSLVSNMANTVNSKWQKIWITFVQAVPIMWTGWDGVCHAVYIETCSSVSPPKIVWLLTLFYLSWGRLQGLVLAIFGNQVRFLTLCYNLLSNFRMIWIMSLDSWCWPGNLLFRELIGRSRWALPFQLVIFISYSCDMKSCYHNMHDIEGLILYCE